jgi:hypothetical protein
MTKYRFTSAALFELKLGALYYEQKENGLGIIFLDERFTPASDSAIN